MHSCVDEEKLLHLRLFWSLIAPLLLAIGELRESVWGRERSIE